MIDFHKQREAEIKIGLLIKKRVSGIFSLACIV